MQTLLIEISDQKAINLIHELEELNILRIIKENVVENKGKLSDKYKGVFSKDDARSFNEHVQTMRKEWDNT